MNPPSEIRKVVIPSEEPEQITAQLPSQPLMSLNQKGSLDERAEPALERTKPERTLVLVIDADNQAVVSEPKAALQSTPIPPLAIATNF